MAKVSGPNQQVQQAQLQKAEFTSPNGKPPGGEGELYTVQQGDSLWGIAEQKLGDGNLWDLIARGNPQIKNPERIYPGDQVRMPNIAPRLSQEKVEEKIGIGDVSEQLKGFEDNEQSGVVEKKQLGGLNLLQQKKQLERAEMPQPEARPKAGSAAQMERADMPQPKAGDKVEAQQTVAKPEAKPQLDESVGRAISQLKQERTPITGEAMQRAIKDGISDLDRKAATEEYSQLKGFVDSNADKFSPEAMEKMAVYDKYAEAAQNKGQPGISSKKLDKMFTEMDRVGIDAHIKEAHADAKQLYGAMKYEGGFRPGTDEQKIFDTLEGKSKDQLQAIEQQYPKATKGRDLRKDLKSEMSGNELKRAEALLDGKPRVADSARLNQAINGLYGEHADLKPGADFKEIKDTLAPRSLDERKEIEHTYQQEYGKELRKDLRDLKGKEREEAMGLLDGQDLKPSVSQDKQPGAAPPPKGETRPGADKPGDSKPSADQTQASKLDESASRAVSRLEDAARPISGNMMGAAIKDGIKDLDGKAAGQEYDQLKGFVKGNWNDLSADAKAKWGVYEQQARKSQKEGLEGIPTDRLEKMFGRMDKAGYLDESSGQAIEGLKAQKKPISGEAMKAALLKGTEDWDGGTANEYRDFANYVAKNEKKLSPEAQQQWGIYDQHAQAAISSPDKGFTDARWNAMLSEMEGKGAPKAGGKPGTGVGVGDKKITEERKPGAAKGERPKPGAEAKPTPESRPGRPVPEDIKPAVEAKPSATEGATVQRNYDDAAALFSAMKSAGGFRPGTDEAAIFKTMEAPGFDAKGATEAYKKAYDRDLRKDLKSELSGNEERRAIALLDGNRPLADAARLNQALKGNFGKQADLKWGADASEINKTLEGKSGAELRAIQDAYKNEFGGTLRADLADDLKGADKSKALAFMDAGERAEKSAPGNKPGEGKAAAAAPDGKPGDNKVAAGQPEVMPGANKPAAGQPEVGAAKSGGTTAADAKFDWMGVPEDARSPEMKELLTQIQAMQTGAPPTPQVTKDMMTEQAQYAQQYPGAVPTLDREMAELAQKAGIKSPMSFEDLLFLLNTKYAQNKERQMLDKANQMTNGGGAQKAGGAGQPGAAPYSGGQDPVIAPQTNNLTPQQQAEVQQWMAQAEQLMASMPPAAQQLMQDKQAYDAQAAGQTAPFQGLDGDTQAKVAAIIDGLDQRLLAYSAQDSEAGEAISLNEVNDLINLASQVPPEMLPAMKAAALELALESNFTPEAAQALAAFAKDSSTASQQPGAAPPTSGYDRTAPPGTQTVREATRLDAERREAEIKQRSIAAAAELNKAMKGNWSWLPKPGTDEKSIMDLLKNAPTELLQVVPPATVSPLEREYANAYGSDLRQHLQSELSGNEERQALALLDGKRAVADAALLNQAMKGNRPGGWGFKMGTDEELIFSVLEGKTPNEMRDIIAAYQGEFGKTLRSHIESELSGNEEARALALLDLAEQAKD